MTRVLRLRDNRNFILKRRVNGEFVTLKIGDYLDNYWKDWYIIRIEPNEVTITNEEKGRTDLRKYLVVSPTFSDFRAGEPAAFRVAEAALSSMSPWEIVKHGVYNGHKIELNNDNTEISVWLHNDEKPFKFIVVEV